MDLLKKRLEMTSHDLKTDQQKLSNLKKQIKKMKRKLAESQRPMQKKSKWPGVCVVTVPGRKGWT